VVQDHMKTEIDILNCNDISQYLTVLLKINEALVSGRDIQKH